MMNKLIGLLTVVALMGCENPSNPASTQSKPKEVDTTSKAVTCSYSMGKPLRVLKSNNDGTNNGTFYYRTTIRPKEFGGGLVQGFLFDTAAVVWFEEYYREGFPKLTYTQSDLLPICLTDSVSTLDTTWVRFVPRGDPLFIDFNL